MKDIETTQAEGRPCRDPAATIGRREFLRLLSLASMTPFAAQLSFAESGPARPRYYGVFCELPVGAVKPQGWTKQFLVRQAQGLSGHPENMAYPYDTCMLAGVIPPPAVKHGEIWWPYEQSGYFFDAVARLSALIDDPRVRELHQSALDYIIANSTERGYGASTWHWPNAVIGRGLLADYSATPNSQQREAITGLIQQAVLTHASVNSRDGLNAEEALYLYAITGDTQLLTYADDAYKGYIGGGSFCSAEKINGPGHLREHGVTAAETLKILALTYLYAGNPEALQLANSAYDKVVADSLMPDGGIVSAESMSTSAFGSLHESCDLTDWSWSMGYMLMATGDVRWADLIERTLFNAVPGAVTKDFKQAQYFSGVNQILATSLSNHGSNASTRMCYRAAHDTECCVGNINRAMPNYVIRQWMKTADDGLAAILYGPSELTTTIGNQPVTINQQTDYPFRETVSFRIKTGHPIDFALHLRIPAWCSTASIQVNGRPFHGKYTAGTFAIVKRRFSSGDVIHLTLPMAVRMEEWFDGQSVAFMRGPLLFALEIAEKRVEITKDSPRIERALKGNLIQGFPAVEFYPETEWRYGVDPALKSRLSQIKVVESPMTENPFLAGQSPVHLELPLHTLPNWKPDWNAQPDPLPNGDPVVVKSPTMLPTSEERQMPGTASVKKMLPYGATHLRLTTLPLIEV